MVKVFKIIAGGVLPLSELSVKIREKLIILVCIADA